jgi:lysine-N-methylase
MPDSASNPRPTYAGAFRCIGPACEDHCCGDWDIPVDQATYNRYQLFPAEKLGALVSAFVFPAAPGSPPALHAHIYRAPSGLCPFFGEDRLCAIQQQYGPQLLSATCSVFPRSLSRVHGVVEGSLSLSCPEAARNVLLDPDFMHLQADLFAGAFRTDNIYQLEPATLPAAPKPYGSFLAIRNLLLGVVKDRRHSIQHRVLLLGIFCEHLQKLRNSPQEEAIPEFLAHFEVLLQQPELHAEIETLPGDPALRLGVVMALTDERVRDNIGGGRFRDTFWDFIQGIGTAESASGDDIAKFLDAKENYYLPFLENSPFILENYLLNYFFQNLFPFGREGSTQSSPRDLFDEYLLLATQFAWIETLLIGISALHRENFAAHHIVATIQSFTRAVEHFPFMRAWIAGYLKARDLNHLQGMALLLKTS